MTASRRAGVRKNGDTKSSTNLRRPIRVTEVVLGGKPITPKTQQKLGQRIFEILTQTA